MDSNVGVRRGGLSEISHGAVDSRRDPLFVFIYIARLDGLTLHQQHPCEGGKLLQLQIPLSLSLLSLHLRVLRLHETVYTDLKVDVTKEHGTGISELGSIL
ncbi:hypothetical protein SAY86_012824 [Trapa natans]|uniref:Uncharacterized protein n=1 Tax=Trapa natans TaxID=22666 RepID=A0AAN7MDJ5_TRANT|nr:hypothetical protein SAY86_012824 [Trapa natans]